MKAQKKKVTKKLKTKSNSKTFLEHLQELKFRFFTWFAFFVIGSLIGYFIYPPLLSWLIAPLGKPLYYTSPTGGFETVFGVSVFFGFVVSIPILLYQTIKFLEPTFLAKSVRSYLWIILSSLVLAASGILLCYYLVLPAALKFLGKFGGEELSALISTQDYFSFVTKYLLGFAVLFQLPLAMLLVNKFKKLKVRKLLGNFKYVFLASFIIAAILTPTPDLVNQTIMALPIITLYLISVMMIWLASIKHEGIDRI